MSNVLLHHLCVSTKWSYPFNLLIIERGTSVAIIVKARKPIEINRAP
jgi:hypothetical protein